MALLIGLATVTATAFGWRAAQIGSTAAFDDRQSISETVGLEQATVQRTTALAADVREYARYRADYAVARAMDREAARLGRTGQASRARRARTGADALRDDATRRAAEVGVFGQTTIADDLLAHRTAPRPFDLGARSRALAAEQSSTLAAPVALNPERWSRSADAIRERMHGLARWAFVVLLALPLYAVAEVTGSMRAMGGLMTGGILVYLVGLSGGLSTVFF